jgi:NTE family protein
MVSKEYNIIALGGGGVKGIAYIGVFKKLQELINTRKLEESKENFDEKKCILPKINIKTICGVSVGSMFGLTYILGYNYVEMLEEVLTTKFDKFKNIRIMNFLNNYGLDTGENLMNWLGNLMIKKGFDKNITFNEFYEKTKIDFQVMSTNLNKYCYTKFNYSCTPNVKVLDAVRMSISIPFVFTANKYEGNIHCDGGLIDNYPIDLFKDNLENVLGFKLINHGELTNHEINESINDIESYIYHILTCYVVQKEKHTTRLPEYKKCTVYIHTENITHSVNFGLSAIDKTKLIDVGYIAAHNFFN